MFTTQTPQLRAGRREWAGLAVLMIPVLLISIDNTVLGFAIPAISTGLHPTGTQLLWIVDIYALMLAGLLVAMGSIGDRVGRRKLLIIGAFGFGLASLLAAFSTSAEMLIVARALLGLFGATLMPSTLSLIRNIFLHDRDRRVAIATWAAMFSGGAALGPIVGGILLEHFHWSSIFYINLPLIAIFIPAAILLLPESRDPNPGRIDPFSIVLSMLMLTPLVFAIKHVMADGVDLLFWASISVAAAAGTGFVLRQLASSNPMLDVRLFANKVFTSAVLSNLLSVMGLAGFLYFGTQLLQLVLGLSPVEAALVLVPGLATSIAAGYAAVPIIARLQPRVVVPCALVLNAVGLGIVAFSPEHSVTGMLVSFLILGMGIGTAEVITNDLILAAVPANKAGAASAISETAYEFGSVMGTAVLGGLSTMVYGVHLQSLIGAEAGAAEFETLGSALESAGAHGGRVGGQIAEAAVASFDLGVQWAAGAAVVLALTAAVLTSFGLKGAGRLLPGSAGADDIDGRTPTAAEAARR
ncbi:MAG: MFS transporter [Brevibacterium sp.]|uniref:MFS transporter n=1 Tax=Brevibacterium sp. TaxID=1701 RepID=UPI0026493735|nr:MFS transporter [Brevibacterium sp.]MDN5806822.1 MFS transporter [Brevibacterium sp.]MDN5833118.1 MFS transporter [Brevibacterium sp.]MDN5876561.1 MFS transporter [Brevibacterium sp.]MDN6122359.1 MFS transporter [Brevibacterium sp.]MDN6175016.1 MFS transporter [Brevibacterium sp.]